MDQVNEIYSPFLLKALTLWTGWGSSSYPKRNNHIIIQEFGVDAGQKILESLINLEDDFYMSDAKNIAKNFIEMEKLASNEFKGKHPELPDKIAEIFAWCYSFDYK